ncbi:MAG: hypothetical protein Q4F84_00790, partial [Fibrobacter sp.]|nr:hypothetical protein [Fibrobacter sp.]
MRNNALALPVCRNVCMRTGKKAFIVLICMAVLSVVNAGIHTDPFSCGMANILNTNGNRIETAIFNPAILGSLPEESRCIRFVPVNSYSVGYWSDKLALTPYREYFSITENGKWQRLLNQLINSSFKIENETPKNASKKITRKIKDGTSVYAGLDISLMGTAIGNIAVNIGTSAHIETSLPATPFLVVFSESNGLKYGSDLSLADFSIQARVTTDIDIAYGNSIDLSSATDFFNALTRNITDFKHSSWGVGLTISLGHGYVNMKTTDGEIQFLDNGSSLIVDATVNLKTAGTGLYGNWNFRNPYEDGFRLAGIGAGVNAGVHMYGEKSLFSVSVQKLGPMIWNNINERQFNIRTKKLSVMTLFENDIDIFDSENGGLSPKYVTLKTSSTHYSWMPTRFNLDLGYRFDFGQKFRALSEYTSTFLGYEQSLA